MNLRKTLAVMALAATAYAGSAGTAQAAFVDTTADGATYTLSWTNVGNLYTFTYVANFTGYTGTAATDNDYAMAFSIASVPGSVDWTMGSITTAPGTESLWSINMGVVTNSNGCPAPGAASKDWCIGLNSGTLTGDKIATTGAGSILTWVFTMTLTAGSPDFSGSTGNEWSNKFVTTDGTYCPDCKPNASWNFGNYQVSETFTNHGDTDTDSDVPEPGTLALLGLGLLGLGAVRRRKA